MYLGILPAANQRLSMTEIEIDSQDTKKPRKWSQVWRAHYLIHCIYLVYSLIETNIAGNSYPSFIFATTVLWHAIRISSHFNTSIEFKLL